MDLINRTQERIKATGEVFTPDALVGNVLNQLPADVWIDPNKTWLEPTCGDGNFLVAIYQRLMESLAEWEPDSQRRRIHIIENMLFGVDLMQDNVDACIQRLGANGLNHNIVCADGLTYAYDFGRAEDLGGECEVLAESADKIQARNDFLGIGKAKRSKETKQDLPSDLFG